MLKSAKDMRELRKGKPNYISAFEMKYTGGKVDSCIEVVPYDVSYAKQYIQIYNACFYDMRKEYGIRPYEFYQKESQLDNKSNNCYLYIQNGEMIGSFILNGNEIDDLIVNPRYQGCGYGRLLLCCAIAMLQEQKAFPIILHVAAKNEKAVHLYEKNGFEPVLVVRVKRHNKVMEVVQEKWRTLLFLSRRRRNEE